MIVCVLGTQSPALLTKMEPVTSPVVLTSVSLIQRVRAVRGRRRTRRRHGKCRCPDPAQRGDTRCLKQRPTIRTARPLLSRARSASSTQTANQFRQPINLSPQTANFELKRVFSTHLNHLPSALPPRSVAPDRRCPPASATIHTCRPSRAPAAPRVGVGPTRSATCHNLPIESNPTKSAVAMMSSGSSAAVPMSIQDCAAVHPQPGFCPRWMPGFGPRRTEPLSTGRLSG
jgi:hypothetical protein